MLIELTRWLIDLFGPLSGTGLMEYISFRAGMALIISLLVSMVFGRRIINYLRRQQVGETVRDLGLDGQLSKAGTPTMGGVIIIMAILIPFILLAKLDNIYVIIMIVSTIWMGVIGFTDDYIKVFKKNKKGLKGKFKLMGQLGLGLIISLTMLFNDQVAVRMEVDKADEYGLNETVQVGEQIISHKGDEEVAKADYKSGLTNIPFLKKNQFNYYKVFSTENSNLLGKILFVLLVIVVVMAVSNGANLTDGLDGLATGVSAIIGATLGIFAYVSSNAIAADYLNILHLPGTGELVVFAASFMGATIGFLWYNSYPASVFMGDTGSLTLGGIIAALAILLRKELLIPIMCGIFLVENLSVLIQVSYFKYTKKRYGEGRRIFRMAPLHHHYQKKNYPEAKIVTRFWIVGILLAVLTIITLKVR